MKMELLKNQRDLMYNKHMRKLKSIFAVVTIVSTLSFLNPLALETAKAQTESCPDPYCFDGISLFHTICTCDYYYYWMFFPIFNQAGMQGPFPTFMSMPLWLAYPEYIPGSMQGYVGRFNLGNQDCSMYYGYGCVTFPTYGTVRELDTGTSQPGGGGLFAS
ncbi:MAG: hypothetical protein K0S38_946 [Candidatus Paceibacter sp.]|jgi:hypothetical protein|nr:hypothetical protein [Candidatus Paceibacter sp.]